MSPKSFMPALLLAASVAAVPAAALAETAQLRTHDLDLTSVAGKAELSRRIDVAARKACQTAPQTGTRIDNGAGLAECMADVRRQVEMRLALRGTGEGQGR